jgi:hypothetical protein
MSSISFYCQLKHHPEDVIGLTVYGPDDPHPNGGPEWFVGLLVNHESGPTFLGLTDTDANELLTQLAAKLNCAAISWQQLREGGSEQ